MAIKQNEEMVACYNQSGKTKKVQLIVIQSDIKMKLLPSLRLPSQIIIRSELIT